MNKSNMNKSKIARAIKKAPVGFSTAVFKDGDIEYVIPTFNHPEMIAIYPYDYFGDFDYDRIGEECDTEENLTEDTEDFDTEESF